MTKTEILISIMRLNPTQRILNYFKDESNKKSLIFGKSFDTFNEVAKLRRWDILKIKRNIRRNGKLTWRKGKRFVHLEKRFRW